MIVSGQISREEALKGLDSLPYQEDNILSEKEYIAKKFSISTQELDRCLSQAPKTYKDFPNQKNLIQWFYKIYGIVFN
jgi:hypothetical protein